MSDEFWNRLESSIHKTETCWIWTGRVKIEGSYIRSLFYHDGYDEFAYRLMYRLFNGDIYRKEHIHHTCNNSLCVNPEHLIKVSPQFNTAERNSRNINCPNCRKTTAQEMCEHEQCGNIKNQPHQCKICKNSNGCTLITCPKKKK